MARLSLNSTFGHCRFTITGQGSHPLPGNVDGNGTAAMFSAPTGLAVDAAAGFLYVTDTDNATVRRIDLNGGQNYKVVTIVGNSVALDLQTAVGALPASAICNGIALDATTGLLYLSTNDGILASPF